jgi:uncharacterized membrane protein YphA (DoxX/SURF4 family)
MFQKLLSTTGNFSFLLIRLTVGLIFLSEGIQKFLFPGKVGAGRLTKIGFSNPEFWAQLVACFEIAGGILILMGFLSKRIPNPVSRIPHPISGLPSGQGSAP